MLMASLLLCAAMLLVACNQHSANTAQNNSPAQSPEATANQNATNQTATAATPVATAIPVVSPTGATAPPSPAATATPGTTPPPTAQATPPTPAQPGAPAGQDGKQMNPNVAEKMMDPSKVVFTTGRPKPVAEPTLPPAPTPTPRIENGKMVQDWQAPAEFVAMKNPTKGKPNAVKIGREYYMQRCEACHGSEGKGNGGMSKLGTDKGEKGATNLASTMVQANTDGELFYKVTNAKPPHPASRERFTDEQRWYIVTFLRTFKPGK
jgi:mono/diheme cytochrome c family protein